MTQCHILAWKNVIPNVQNGQPPKGKLQWCVCLWGGLLSERAIGLGWQWLEALSPQ